jgi:hypothetical protein
MVDRESKSAVKVISLILSLTTNGCLNRFLLCRQYNHHFDFHATSYCENKMFKLF